MEVHAHPHTVPIAIGRKKWTHYLWEFFMLFLAVTAGFFVENQREHMVEHRREKEFMVSLVKDLESDTAQISRIRFYKIYLTAGNCYDCMQIQHLIESHLHPLHP